MAKAFSVLAATRPAAGPGRLAGGAGTALLLLAALAPGRLAAAEVHDGLVVEVPSAIDTSATNRLRAALYAPLKRFEAARKRDPGAAGVFTLVCDFNPDGRPS